MPFIKRSSYLSQINKAFRSHSIVAILGPRQCGKTTLARDYVERKKLTEKAFLFDLEDPADLAVLQNPKTVLESLDGLVIIDEIQRIPELFPILRVLVDQPKFRRKFLILGSASRDLIRQSSETLAGRIAYIELTPFSLAEVDHIEKLWLQGGFPHSYLAKSVEDSIYWRKQYISTFLERDIPNLGIRIPPSTLRRFWTMLAHYHGQLSNFSEIGTAMGIADTTARHYLDILAGSFMVRQLLPWFSNSKKRQVKTPKIYFRDSGIYHTLSGISDRQSLMHHPKLGASWEGFALEEVIRLFHAEPEECFFWAVHNQAELDLLIVKDGLFRGFEFKYSDSPSITKSMEIALGTLKLDSLHIIYPGKKNYTLKESIQVCGLENLSNT